MAEIRRRRGPSMSIEKNNEIIGLAFEYGLSKSPYGVMDLKTGKMYNPKDLRRKILKLNPYFFIDRNARYRREGNLDSIDKPEDLLPEEGDGEECDERTNECCNWITGVCKSLIGLGGKTKRRNKNKNKRNKKSNKHNKKNNKNK